jgi:hypothetical protein
MGYVRRFAVAFATAILVVVSVAPPVALALNENHGIGLSKGCIGATKIGDPYKCSYSITNNTGIDEAGDTLTITSLVDTINRPGSPASGNILQIPGIAANVTFQTLAGNVTPPSCANLGTPSAICTLPSQSRIRVGGSGGVPGFSFYTVVAADYTVNPTTHVLTDSVALTWQDTCSSGTNNCPQGNQSFTTGSSTTVQKLNSTTATTIHNAAHGAVTTVSVGTTVHDLVTVTGEPNKPPPGGNVNIDWFLNGDCTGTPAQNSGSVGPLVNGSFDATAFSFTVTTPGFRAFRAHYPGDATYNPSDGPCEPLRVVDANIQISPLTATNPTGTNHTLTGHVNVNDGTDFVSAPDGTAIGFSILSGPGSFVGGVNSCTTSGGTGSCTVQITSTVTGTTVIRATSTVTVVGVALTRATGDGLAGDSDDAQKSWGSARISIAPNATNEIGQPHTFTVTLEKNTGSGFVPAAGEHVTVTLTDSNGATHLAPTGTCTNAGANTSANGQCTITFTSPTAGKVTGHASATLAINGGSITVQTDGTGGSSVDAVKTFVDANIQISPLNATNPIGTNHTLTGHVNVNDGSGSGYVNAPNGTTITFSLTNAGGAAASFVGPGSCTTASGSGSCTVVISSPTTGTTTIHATTTVSVAGVSLTRATGDGKTGDSVDAQKVWQTRDANIQISPATATNEARTNHSLTGHVNVNTGAGFVNAPDGTAINFFLSGVGSFVGGVSTCTTGGGTGSCSIQITSTTPGTTTIKAVTDVLVNGVSLHRATGDGLPGDSADAQKTWVDANVQITPATATNPVGTNHTLTGHVNVNSGSGFVNAPAGTTIGFAIVSGPGSFVGGTNTCTTAGTTGECAIQITSSTGGVTIVKASTTVTVGGVSLHRETSDGLPGDGANAQKAWADLTVATSVRDAANNDVTTQLVNPGTVVHDVATVTRTAATPTSVPDPTGTVDFTLYSTGSCEGSILATDAGEQLVNGTATSTTFSVPSGGGSFSYLAHYNGDANYPAANGPCEPFGGTTTLPCPAGSFTFHLEANGDLTIVYDQFPAPNDNSYGVNAVGWPNGHTFNNLVGSDHAGFQLIDPSNVVRLDFSIDYISTKTGTPSGYGSLGPFGGDGRVNIGTLTAADIAFDSSLARNLNNTGYFVNGTQVIGTNVANLLLNSPPTTDTTSSYTLTPAAVAVFTAPNPDSADSPGWNFHDTYFVTVKAAKLASLGFNFNTWKVQPNADELHNSPAKPCPVVGGTALSVATKKVDKKQVIIGIKNTGTADAFISAIQLTWPQAVNGNLLQVKLAGAVLYNTPTGGGSVSLAAAQLPSDPNKLKVGKGKTVNLTFIFANNASPTFTDYTGTVSFGSTDLTILP